MSILPPRRRTARKLSFRTAPLDHCLDDWIELDRRLAPDHPARAIARAVNRLDFGPLWDLYAGRGSPAYPPQLLLAAALYEVQCGHHSPAQWHRHARESDPVRWLLRGFTPARSCWYQFRDRVGPALLGLAQQAVRGAIAAGFTPARRAALDGTLLAANASRHRLLDQTALAQRCAQLQQAVAADTAATPPRPPQAGTAGTAPSVPAPAAGTAAAAPPRWLAATARGRRQQAERYRKAREEMARRQARNRQKRASKRTDAERIVLAPADPEAAVSRDKEKVFRPLYNVQLLDDLDSPLILGWLVAAQPTDAGLLGPVLRQARDGLGVTVAVAVADAGYAGGADLAEAERLGATVYAPWQANDFTAPKEAKYYPKEQFQWLPEERAYECPQGQRLTYRGSSRQKRSGTERVELQTYRGDEATCGACPARARCTSGRGARTISRSEHEGLIEALRARMASAEAKALYRLRKQTVELANADLKGHRGLRRLSGRGLRRAEGQVGLAVLAHNLVALDGLRRKRRDGAAA